VSHPVGGAAARPAASAPAVGALYARFRRERRALRDALVGLDDPAERDLYAAITLDRVTLLCFLQALGALGGDPRYLATRLAAAPRGAFFRGVFLPLCHGALDRPRAARDPALAALGDVPHVGGGLFGPHPLERRRGPELDVPDAAFARLLEFVSGYRWELAPGPADPGRIDPAVVGYLFEKHVNEREAERRHGAYYTQEDITDWMAARAVLPALIDLAREEEPALLGPDDPAWAALARDPGGFVPPDLQRGLDLDGEAGALPSETPRERAARQERARVLLGRLRRGEVRAVGDLITANLDLEAVVRAVLAAASPPRLAALWRALEGVTVLDPTCGSGAFLLAALRLLADVRLAAVARLRDLAAAGRAPAPLRGVLEAHDTARAGPRAAALRAVLVDNLYGVDLMPEAVEACRLRLLLRLVAEASRPEDLEPLPALDDRIRRGDALVGAALDGDGPGDPAAALGVEAADAASGRAEAAPFDWGAAFPEVARRGGFRAVVGNPPYLSSRRVAYRLEGYRTAGCPNTYAWVLERSARLLHPRGACAMIVPLSLTFGRAFEACREVLYASYRQHWFASFARIPAGLFTHDTRTRNAIHVARRGTGAPGAYTTRLHRWNEAFRPHLFATLAFAPFDPTAWGGRVPKLPTGRLIAGFERLLRSGRALGDGLADRSAPEPAGLCYRTTAYNFVMVARTPPPCYERLGAPTAQTKVATLPFPTASERDLALVVLAGKLAFAYWVAVGDDFDVTRWNLTTFPCDPRALAPDVRRQLLARAEPLDRAMRAALQFKKNSGRWVGTYNLGRCRDVTDAADAVLARALGVADAWEDVELLHDQTVRTDYEVDAAVAAAELEARIAAEQARA